MCLLQPPGSVALLLGQYKKKRQCSDTLVSTRNVFIVHLQKMGTRIDCCVAQPLQSDDNVSAQKPNGKKKVERINKNGCNRHMIHVPSSNVVGWIMTSPWKNGRACLVLFSWMTHLSIICDTQTWHPLNCGFIVIVWGFWWGFFVSDCVTKKRKCGWRQLRTVWRTVAETCKHAAREKCCKLTKQYGSAPGH